MLNNRIEELRSEFNYSQDKLGELIGVSAREISYYEIGGRPIKCDVAIKIAEVFNVSLDYLFYRTNIRNNNLEMNRQYIGIIADATKDEMTPDQLKKAIEYIKGIHNLLSNK